MVSSRSAGSLYHSLSLPLAPRWWLLLPQRSAVMERGCACVHESICTPKKEPRERKEMESEADTLFEKARWCSPWGFSFPIDYTYLCAGES